MNKMITLTNFGEKTNTNIMSMHITSHSNTWNPHVQRFTRRSCPRIWECIQAALDQENQKLIPTNKTIAYYLC